MRSTLAMHQFEKPAFDPQAQYIAARPLKWGNNEHGYVTIPAARDDALETVRPLDFDKMKPPCDHVLAARLYRTGFLAMLLTDEGEPLIRTEQAKENPMRERHPVSELTKDWPAEKLEAVELRKAELRAEIDKAEPTGATCPRCGRQFKGHHVPHFHKIRCEKAA